MYVDVGYYVDYDDGCYLVGGVDGLMMVGNGWGEVVGD